MNFTKILANSGFVELLWSECKTVAGENIGVTFHAAIVNINN